MEVIGEYYRSLENRILRSLANNGVQHRTKSAPGLWLGPLMGLSAAITLLREDGSYSEICLLTGIAGVGLIISCLCLFSRLAMEKTAAKDFQVLYFLPAIVTSMLLLLVADKGLLVSVAWGLSVGTLSTWGVLQVMSYFPGCFTIGEASAVTHAGILFLLSAASNLPLRYHLPPIHSDDIATVILQVGILFVATVCLLCTLFPVLRSPLSFYLTAFGLLSMGVIPLLHIILDRSPLLWIWNFALGNTNRISIVSYWALCVAMGIGVIAFQVLLNSKATTCARKPFHVLAVLVYVPGLIAEPTFLYLASGVIMGLFLALELMRILKLPPLGDILQKGFTIFADKKDILISLTPLYLLSGCSFPLWLPSSNLSLLPLLSGVLSIGIGDTAASFVGNKFGKHKWSGSEKSMEGTLACILSQLMLIYGLAYFGYVSGYGQLLRSTLAVLAVSIVEAKTDQVDNLALPPLMYMALKI